MHELLNQTKFYCDLYFQAESKVVNHSGGVKTYCWDCSDKETSFTPLTQSSAECTNYTKNMLQTTGNNTYYNTYNKFEYNLSDCVRILTQENISADQCVKIFVKGNYYFSVITIQ